MKNPDKDPFSLELNWKITIFTILLLPLLVSLGFWQLQRADEKSTIQQLVAEQQALPPAELTASTAAQMTPYRRVVFSGAPEAEHIWLLENQLYQGRLGYHMIVPVALSADTYVLVNCGWISGAERRDQLPQIPALPEAARFFGQIRQPSYNRFLRGEALDAGWPKRILQMDIAVMSQALGKPLLPWVIQLDETSPMAQTVHWPIVNMSADKHLGYAAQWFLMAIALVILWVFANTNLGRRKKEVK
ncbi:SURF1 family protein [Saccharophagus sp. K07]|uniref:SURF1 family protein n=1 Tax=Saccharophagus sp. K07 TaxID=2283636 RepID=UPI0016520C1F|nr:SURF1 family protein [Saccharophagus sp. K07]